MTKLQKEFSKYTVSDEWARFDDYPMSFVRKVLDKIGEKYLLDNARYVLNNGILSFKELDMFLRNAIKDSFYHQDNDINKYFIKRLKDLVEELENAKQDISKTSPNLASVKTRNGKVKTKE
jgi:hypothetical protein